MSNGELLQEVMAVLSEEIEVPTKVSQRFVAAALVEVYRMLRLVDKRLIVVENCINNKNESKKDLKWALEKIALPVIMLVLGIILAHIFGGVK